MCAIGALGAENLCIVCQGQKFTHDIPLEKNLGRQVENVYSVSLSPLGSFQVK